jgi:hypothetical protein
VRVLLTADAVEIRLSRWQKILGLMRDIVVARAHVSEVCVVADPIGVVLQSGIKVGLRVPWLYYVARTVRLDEAFIVRRGVPALSFAVDDGRPLRRVLISSSQAAELAQRLRAG